MSLVRLLCCCSFFLLFFFYLFFFFYFALCCVVLFCVVDMWFNIACITGCCVVVVHVELHSFSFVLRCFDMHHCVARMR